MDAASRRPNYKATVVFENEFPCLITRILSKVVIYWIIFGKCECVMKGVEELVYC
jgi:hypothetical protein